MKLKGFVLGASLSLAMAAMPSTVAAAPMGTVSIANCSGGGVIVTATSIDWTDPVGGGSGCMQTGIGTDVDYTGGNLLPGTEGTILDLQAGDPFPVANFMTFAGHPLLSFALSGFASGSANQDCAGLAVGESCSVFAGSPFVLTLDEFGGTAVRLSPFGTATDGDGVANWSGAFTAQFFESPEEIQALFLNDPNAAIDNTYSARFNVRFEQVPVPEPLTLGLLGLGLFGVAVRARRRS